MKKKALTGTIVIAALLVVVLLYDNFKPKEEVDFSADIKPILNTHCISCHGGVKKNAGFSLLFEKEALGDTKSGKPAIIPGDASASDLIRRIKEDDPELRMPYEKAKLSKNEIDLLTRWVNQGAKWGDHWAYSLPDKVDVPPVNLEAGFASSPGPDFLKNDIDNFILTRMEDKQLSPNVQAEKNVLARRLALDITGLPPGESLFREFITQNLSYEVFVDSLLAQKSYGEKWASWWLDMARYSDTKGYEKDQGRSIYHYRDWVIRALNNNMPFDQFTIEQLAGDLLPEPTVDQYIATAFHRNTMNNDEGGTEDEEYRMAAVIDRVNTTFEVWQSTTIGCVQCHSHPYDPFKNEEYYQLMAFFNNSRDEDIPSEAPVLKFYSPDQKKKVDQINNWITQNGNPSLAKQYANFMSYTEPVNNAHDFVNFKNGSYDDHAALNLWDDGSCQLKDLNTKGGTTLFLKYNSGYNGTVLTFKQSSSEGKILARINIDKTQKSSILKIPFGKVEESFDLFVETNNDRVAKNANVISLYWIAVMPDLPGKANPGYGEINDILLEVLNAETPTVPIMIENPDYRKRTTQVFERGNWLLKGDTVLPATPQLLNPWDDKWSKDRLGLSKWLISKQNPLTARTIVNRVWHQIFGRGLVATIEDIGSQSDPPSHPALLDWLALRFMNEHNWSIKSLIKEIVMSGTYGQSSESTTDNYLADIKNEYYARGPRLRLSAEQIRDQALAVSGLLSKKMYGPGVMPPQPENVWQTVYSGAQWIESVGEDRYRRAIYTYLKRTSPYPSYITFDAGSREVCTIRRTVTNTPLQALVMLNDPVYMEAAYNLATIMDDENIEKGIAKGYKRALMATATADKLDTLLELYEVALEEFTTRPEEMESFIYFDKQPNAKKAALTVVANAIMNLDEFLTKA
ncbi:PSD1 and planctomycete cytochrome C domain-containing protein [Muriicola sp. Z0-33]|uniref:PSD1 and planctomycete cytochrome C domain-containing protein n=1 Tax=Muriicola sp. Z0-33 TaxID=2816957 RepID=UPI002238B320|nr:PSD1 and planctomycete cytochrome C domain-containing protein [Muriicola sp. Z0-33]MCW5517905.1 DUF1553 domain-containing protein [Muriicola sp. Z0-33]